MNDKENGFDIVNVVTHSGALIEPRVHDGKTRSFQINVLYRLEALTTDNLFRNFLFMMSCRKPQIYYR